MRKRIILAGYTGFINYGDQFIAHCCDYLVNKTGINLQIEMLDFSQRNRDFRWYCYGGVTLISRFLNNGKLEYWLYKKWHEKRYENTIREADGIIIACGSFKYTTQSLWASYSLIVEIAKKYNIPVMFDAMNVQKYDVNNEKCKILKQHLNYDNVKIFTSRDGMMGVNRLSENYVDNKDLLLYPAGDPAFWLNECYKIERNKESNVIGINLIDGDVFRRYGKTLGERDLLKVYVDLINKLEKEGKQWELFTNGLEGDYAFGEKLLSTLGYSNRSVVVPKDAYDLSNIVSGYKVILGARLHASICAYSLDIPVVGYIWDDKLIGFSKMAKIEQFFLQENELTGSRLYDLLIRAMDFKYDDENKDYWKKQTYDTIKLFLEKYC